MISLRTRRKPQLVLQVQLEKWPLKTPFRITGYTFIESEVVVVTLRENGVTGRGEATGVYYRHDTPTNVMTQIEAVREQIESGVSRQTLHELLPAGGARNALDCALWDLEAKRTGRPVWSLIGFKMPRPLLTTSTLGAGDPARMAGGARASAEVRALKLKLTGDGGDAERVRAVRAARPDAWLMVDANQGFTRASFERLLPVLVEARVELVEQPFPVGHEAKLDGFDSTIPIAADESVQDCADMDKLVGRFDVVNIKLDKCGGLTEALAMVTKARRLGLELMVGNMTGTSLAMAPAFLLGQHCKVVDLDGPLLLESDRSPRAIYENGCIRCPEALWGGP